jgi:hypothetical protein
MNTLVLQREMQTMPCPLTLELGVELVFMVGLPSARPLKKIVAGVLKPDLEALRQ